MSPFFDQKLETSQPWLDASGPAADMVISTRGRLARNLSAHDFPHHAQVAEREKLSLELLESIKEQSGFDGCWHLDFSQLTANQMVLLHEKHLTGSLESTPGDHRHLLVAPGGATTALVNGEDHVRLHVYESGFHPQSALSRLQSLEEELEKTLDFAFLDDFGYLTASPVNAGTGLRLSVLVHLPGLVMGGEIDKILNALRQLRFGVCGLAGGGAAVRGAVFLISNLVTLGRDESEITSDFEFHLGKVLRHERTARQQLFSRDSLGLEDMAHRSLAVLQSARLMTSQEAADRLSHLRLGVGLGMMPGIDFPLLNEAMMLSQTAHLHASADHDLTVAEKTEARATLLRDLFFEI